jgi:hypothetical protein
MLEGIKRSRAARQFRRLVKPGFGEPISGDELAQLENSWVQMRVDPAALTPTTPAAAKYALGWGKKKTKQVTVFGRQEGAGVGYNPRYRGKRSYDCSTTTILCHQRQLTVQAQGCPKPEHFSFATRPTSSG